MTQPSPAELHFDGSHASVLAVMQFVDAGRDTTIINIHAAADPAETHISFPTPDGTVRINAGDWIVRTPDGQLAARRMADGSQP